MKKETYRMAVFLAVVLILSTAVNYGVHRWDNKYQYNSRQQPVCGVMELSAAELQNQAYYICDDWEFYRGELLTPEDFHSEGSGGLVPDAYVRLGQYAGFELSDREGEPHGSATYRLRLMLPEKPGKYMLELPEIFSACRLWIDGAQVFQSGEPDPGRYRPEVVQTRISFDAAGDTELIFNVSDFTHYYSGMVYPPAFGTEQNVDRLLSARLAVKSVQCFFAGILLLSYLVMWAVNRRDKRPLCFAMICAGYLGYAGYLLVHTFIPTGRFFWYRLEDLSFLFMLFFLCELAGIMWGERRSKRTRLLMRSAGGLMMAASLIVPHFFTSGGLQLMLVWGGCVDAYKLVVVGWLLVHCCAMLLRGMDDTRLLLGGLLFFGVSLAADRLDGQYEPVLAGWGAEYGGFALLCILAVMIVHGSIAAQRRNRELVENEERREAYMREVVHDLNSPLALITTYAELSKLGIAESEDQQREFLTEISERARELSDRIRRLRHADLSELSQMNFTAVDSLRYLYSLRDKYSILLARKGVAMRVEGSAFSLRIDREKMDIAMENLIMNSLRFTEPGGNVVLSARIVNGKKELSVRDTGAGIDAAALNRIFERGYTEDRTEHSGLGLSIVARIAAAHQGTVSVKSAPESGSCFILRLQ